MTKIRGIYSILHTESGKVYIGSSKNTKRRIGAHKTDLKYSKHPNHALQNYYNKYGLNAFEFTIIFTAFDNTDLIAIENDIISQVNNTELFATLDRTKLFNTQWANKTGCVDPSKIKRGIDHHSYGIVGPNKGRIFSDDIRKNMSEGQKGKKFINRQAITQAHKDNISAGKCGKPWTQARRDAQKTKD